MHKFLVSLLVLGTLSAQDNWAPYLEFSGRTNNYRHGGGGLLFAPLQQGERAILFAQGGVGHWWKNTTGTLGVGLRALRCEGWAWGVNAFIDLAYSDHRNVYVQGSAGAELFWCGWDLRFNGYLPTSEKRILRRLTTQEVFALGNDLFYRRDGCVAAEAIYRGFDIDAGYCLPICCGSVQLRAGYFHYESAHVPDVNGPRMQLGYRQDRLFGFCGWEAYVGGEYEYSKHRGNIASGFLSLRIPFCCSRTAQCCSLCSTLRRLGDPVRRAESLYIRAWSVCGGKAIAPCITPAGNQMQVFYAAGGSDSQAFSALPAGTYHDPMTIEQAMAAAGPFDIIVCLDRNGPIESDQPCQLQMGQLLVGTNGGAPIITPDGPLNIPFSRTPPIIDWTGPQFNRAVVIPDIGNQVIGLCIDGSTRVECGLGRPYLRDLRVRSVEIRGVTVGVLAQFYENVSVKNTYIHDVRRAGIDIRNCIGEIEVVNNRIERFGFASSQGRGIMVLGDNEDAKITIGHNRIISETTAVDAGIYARQNGNGIWNCSIHGNRVEGLNGPGIEVRKAGSGGVFAVEAMANHTLDCTQQGLVALTESGGSGEFLFTARDNTDQSSSSLSGIDIRSHFDGQTHLTLLDNFVIRPGAANIGIRQTAGTVGVYLLDQLSDVNQGATVTLSGQVDNQPEPNPTVP